MKENWTEKFYGGGRGVGLEVPHEKFKCKFSMGGEKGGVGIERVGVNYCQKLTELAVTLHIGW